MTEACKFVMAALAGAHVIVDADDSQRMVVWFVVGFSVNLYFAVVVFI